MAKVYFTRKITSENLIKIYEILGIKLNVRRILPYAEQLGLGSRKYELINIDR